MDNEREKLFNSFHSMAIRLIELGAVVQNEMPKEFIDIAIDEFRIDNSRFVRDLAILSEDVVIFLGK